MDTLDKIKELLNNDWRIEIERLDGFSAYASRGDFNCPYRKAYDPADGHGHSQVWAGDIEGQLERGEKFKTLEDAIDLLYEKCMKVIPGEPYEKKV